MSLQMKKILAAWIPFVILATLLSGLVYAAVQHEERMDANDPQVLMAEQDRDALAMGAQPGAVVGGISIDMSQSLGAYVIVYNNLGVPIASSATLAGKVPVIPQGVFSYLRAHGEDRFTWEPSPGVRSAVVADYFSGKASGFVISGRSLRETESREHDLGVLTLIAWLVSIAVLFAWFAGKEIYGV